MDLKLRDTVATETNHNSTTKNQKSDRMTKGRTNTICRTERLERCKTVKERKISMARNT